jgi:hypothetical protein
MRWFRPCRRGIRAISSWVSLIERMFGILTRAPDGIAPAVTSEQGRGVVRTTRALVAVILACAAGLFALGALWFATLAGVGADATPAAVWIAMAAGWLCVALLLAAAAVAAVRLDLGWLDPAREPRPGPVGRSASGGG